MLRGITEIVLTDVTTGKQDKIIENNLVTNAISDILSKSYYGSSFLDALFPLYQKGLGGVLLLDSNIEENANNYIMPYNCNIVGHAGSDNNGTSDKRKGSFNIDESAKLENGYKYVWDFATNQSNGTIKCISLTSAKGGNCGLGNFNINFEESFLYPVETDIVNPATYALSDGEYNYSLSYVGNTLLCVKRYETNFDVLYLTTDFKKYKLKSVIEIDIGIVNKSDIFKKILENNILYILIKDIDENKNKILIISLKDNRLIKSVDISFINITLTDDIDFCVINDTYFVFGNKCMFIGDINNPQDYKKIDLTGLINYSITQVNCIFNNKCLTRDLIINADGTFSQKNHYSYSTKFQNLFNGLIYSGYAYNSNRYKIWLNLYYLATINNLSSPITKTADKTMKVIYTITEN